MLTFGDVTAWHTAPSSWREFKTASQATVGQTTGVTVAGNTAETVRGTTRTFSQSAGLGTASTLDDSATSSSNGPGGGSASGSASSTTRQTSSDTSFSVTNNATSSSHTFSQITALTETATTNIGLQFSWTGTSNTTTDSYSRAWPSTISTTISTTIGDIETTVATGTLLSAVSSSATRGWKTSQTIDTEYSSGDTITRERTTTVGTNTWTTTSATRHEWMDLVDTIIFPDANGGPLYNDALIWAPQGSNSTGSIGLFFDLFGSVASGSASARLDHYERIITATTVWLSYALSTSSATTTKSATTQTGTTSSQSATTVVNTGTSYSSLDGVAWHSTEASTSTEHFIGGLTGRITSTAGEGTDTFTYSLWTFTYQSTGYNSTFEFFTTEATESYGGELARVVFWNTWDRSFETTSEASYPSFTTTLSVIVSFSSDGRRLGNVTTALSVWAEVPSTYTFTDWDQRTNAALEGLYSNSDSASALGGNFTAHTTVSNIVAIWGRTDHFERSHTPSITGQSQFEMYRYARFLARVAPSGLLGMGHGFSTNSPVYAGVSSSVLSGLADSNISLGSNLPRFIMWPDASVLATGRDWLSNHPMSSFHSMGWLSDSIIGSRTSGSLSHHWISYDESSTTVISATYGVSLTGSISGSFFSELFPQFNTVSNGIVVPFDLYLATGSAGAPAAGAAEFNGGVQTATFPAGAISWTFTVTEGGTSSMSTSTSTGELTLTCDRAIVFRFEEALRLKWNPVSAAQLLAARYFGLPEFPWQQDPDKA